MVAARKEDSDRSEELEASREAAMAALDKLLEAKNHFRKAAEAAGMDIKHEAFDQLDKGKEKAKALGEQASDYVIMKPLETLGIAFLAGLVFAHILRK